MNGFSNDYTLQSRDSRSIVALENADRNNERRNQILEQQRSADLKKAAFNAFTSESKDFLLNESMFCLLQQCLPSTINESLLNYGRSIITSFIQEESSYALLNQFKTKTLFLSELASIVESSHRKVIHGCDQKEPPYRINNSEMKAFHDQLDSLDTDSITKSIVSRVTKAEEEFIKANVKDKEVMETLATTTQDKIDKVKNKDADLEKEIKQEHAALYRQNLEKLMSRKKGILESIVTRMSTQIVSEDTIREQFTNESGKLDMQRIIEMSEVMYTFLEMVNTTKIKAVTPDYLKSTLSSIK